MVAHADREAVDATLETGQMHYRSRSRGLWHKGATSGNTHRVVELRPDCDGDTILARVVPAGPACHTGVRSCFGPSQPGHIVTPLDQTIASLALAPPAESYTVKLLADRNLPLEQLAG